MHKNILQNKNIHDKVSKSYNTQHSEIYNPYEQQRLRMVVSKVVKLSLKKNPKVLDVGAGTGNMALKFLIEDCEVFASDVSIKSLGLLQEIANSQKLTTVLITDQNLPFSDNTFDIVSTYSVLHHIPDYLHTIKEMIRAARPGGLIYIDHEANRNRYFPDSALQEYYKMASYNKYEQILKLVRSKKIFSLDFLKSFFIKRFVNSRYKTEGDIHVWPDDHIEWDKIKNVIKENNAEIICEEDYLLYYPKISVEKYEEFMEKCNDTKLIVIKKLN